METLQKTKHLIFFELFQYLISPGIYVLYGCFIFLFGLIFVVGLDTTSRILQNEFLMTQMLKCVWIPCFFIVPVITIRKVISEKQNGQLKQLLIIPINKYSIVISKFISALLLFVVLWTQIIVFPFIAKLCVSDLSFNDIIESFSLFPMLIFEAIIIGSFVISFGIFFGYFFESQISAYAMYFMFVFVAFMSGSLLKQFSLITTKYYELFNNLSYKFNIFYTIEDFSLGIIDSRNVIFYIITSFMMIFFASINVKFKK